MQLVFPKKTLLHLSQESIIILRYIHIVNIIIKSVSVLFQVIAKVLFTNTQGQSGQPVLLGTEGGQTIRILNACNVSNNKIISSSPKTITLAQAKQMGLLTPGKLQQILPTSQKVIIIKLSCFSISI